jgi:SdpC family antimicrobial peptide
MIRSFVRTAVIPVLVFQLCAVTGCSGAGTTDGNQDHATSATQSAGYDGHTLFRAVFFNQGPAAAAIADVWASRPELTASRTPDELATLLEAAADHIDTAGLSAASSAQLRTRAKALRDGTAPASDLRSPTEINNTADALIARLAETNPEFFAEFEGAVQSGDPVRARDALNKGGNLLVNAYGDLVTHGKGGDTANPDFSCSLCWVDHGVALYAYVVAAAFAVVAAAVVIEDPKIKAHTFEGDEFVGRVTKAYAR